MEELNPSNNFFSFSLRNLALEITSLQHCRINIFETFFADKPAIRALDRGHGSGLHNQVEQEQSPVSIAPPPSASPR